MSGKGKKNKQKSGQQVQQEAKAKAKAKKESKRLAKQINKGTAKLTEEQKKEAEKLKKQNAYSDVLNDLQEIKKAQVAFQKDRGLLKDLAKVFSSRSDFDVTASSELEIELFDRAIKARDEALYTFYDAKEKYEAVLEKIEKYNLAFDDEDNKLLSEVKGNFEQLGSIEKEVGSASLRTLAENQYKSIFQAVQDNVDKQMPAINQALESGRVVSDWLNPLENILRLKQDADSQVLLFGEEDAFGLDLNIKDLAPRVDQLKQQIDGKFLDLSSKISSQLEMSAKAQLCKADDILKADYRKAKYDKVSMDLLNCKSATENLRKDLQNYRLCLSQHRDWIDPAFYQQSEGLMDFLDNELQKSLKKLKNLDEEMSEYQYGQEYQDYLEQEEDKENEERLNHSADETLNDIQRISFSNFKEGTQQNHPQTVPFRLAQAIKSLNLHQDKQNSINLNTINGVNEMNDEENVNSIRFATI